MAIHDKLLKFQQAGVTLKRDGKNPHYGSTYVTLNEVLEKVKEPLNKLGIVIMQNPEKDGLRTVLLDTEDQTKIESFMPYVETSTAQKLGSNNTYLRRYALVTMLGLEDEDDDGNAASVPKTPVKSIPRPMPQKEVPIIQQDAPNPLINEILCGHGEPAKRVQVKKPGPNKGRWFYACAHPMNEQCDFFLWEEVGDEPMNIEGSKEDYGPNGELLN